MPGMLTLAPPLSDLAQILPPGRLLTDVAELRVYECDALPVHKVAPRAVALCASREEVVAVVRWCANQGVPFVPRGAGTGLSGGATPSAGAVVVDLNLMRRIRAIDPVNRFAVVEPGVINLHLTQATEPYGYIYAPDPSSQSACTLGGNVAENSGGPHCLKYGVTSDHILGIEVVLPNAEVLRLGGPHALPGSLDLVSFFTGSEGTFGLVTEITCRLVPKPEAVRTFLAIYNSMSAACRAVSEITAAGILPVALEILDRRTIRAVEASVYAAGYPEGADAVLLVELDGFEAGMDEDARAIEELCRKQSPLEFRSARDAHERVKLWKGRKGAFGAMGRVDTDLYVLDGCVPRTKLEETLQRVYEIADRHRVVVSNVFHAGDGNLHPNISYDGRDAEVTKRVLAAGEEMLQACVDAGGTISGEHGIGVEKRQFMTMVYDANDLGLQTALRDAIDPKGLANPGKIFPAQETWPAPKALPREVDEIARSIREAHAVGKRLIPAGRGAHAWERPRATGEAAVVSAASLRGILAYDPGDFTIAVAAGTPWKELESALAEHGQEIPLDFAADEAGTVGSVVARAAEGPRSGKYGNIASFLLGVEGLRPTGTPFRSGGNVVKNVTGYQVWKLLAGSRGTLGLLTRANFKVRPLAKRRFALVLTFARGPEAHEAALALRAARLDPAACFVVESAGEPAKLVVVFEGNEATVTFLSERFEQLLEKTSAELAGTSEGERARGVLQWLAGISYPGPEPAADVAIAKFSTVPSRLGALSEETRRIFEEARLREGVSLLRASDVMSGVLTLRWRTRSAPQDQSQILFPRFAEAVARERLEMGGASGTLVYFAEDAVPGLPSNFVAPATQSLEERLMAAFDR